MSIKENTINLNILNNLKKIKDEQTEKSRNIK